MNDGPDQPARGFAGISPSSHRVTQRLLDCVPCHFFVAKDATCHGGEVPDYRARDLCKAIAGQRSTRLRCILQQPGRSFQIASKRLSEIGWGFFERSRTPLVARTTTIQDPRVSTQRLTSART